jgi:hypothetical protein
MGSLDVSRSITINRPAPVVRRQFADIAHHQATNVHGGVRFEVQSDDGQMCRYRQISKLLGPIQLTQEFQIPITDVGPLVNTIIKGPFHGGTISFVVADAGNGQSTVEARIASAVNGIQALALPVLRIAIGQKLAQGLAEDKIDLEGPNYPG